MFALLLATLLTTTAHAENCPQYDGKNPYAVVDVKDFKFFYFPRKSTNEDPNVMLVEQNGQITDTQKVYFWSDDMADTTDFYNKNIDISCTYNFDFISARYHSPEGRVYDFDKGECRVAGDVVHPLICD